MSEQRGVNIEAPVAPSLLSQLIDPFLAEAQGGDGTVATPGAQSTAAELAQERRAKLEGVIGWTAARRTEDASGAAWVLPGSLCK